MALLGGLVVLCALVWLLGDRAAGRTLLAPDDAAAKLATWAAYAKREGMRWRPTAAVSGSILSGTVRGRRVTVTVRPPRERHPLEGASLHAVVEVRAALRGVDLLYNPRLIPVGHELIAPEAPIWGRGLMVQREHLEAVRRLLDDPHTRQQVGSLMAETAGRLKDGVLTAAFSGVPTPEAVIEPLLSVVVCIEEAWEQDWRALAGALGLSLSPMDRQRRWQLTGAWRGVPVTVQLSEEGVVLSARIAGVPDGLEVSGRREVPSERSGSPLLDHLLHIKGAHPCLQDADLAGALLAAIHPHPGAALTGADLHIPAPVGADIEALLELSAEVQEALQAWSTGRP